MEIQSVVCRCNNCNKDFTVEDYNFICPFCQSFNIEVIDGTDMILKSLELEV